MTTTIDDLPDELLEHILGMLPPYQDLDDCRLVSRKWNNAIIRVVQRKKLSLINALKTCNLKWEYGNCEGISLRYAHAACYHDGKLYVFGGFSKNHSTAFNDLLAIDLNTREWTRIMGFGHFPQPKAGATLCAYENKLILYGGCTRTSQMMPLLTFPEIHTFDLNSKVWTRVQCKCNLFPPLSCHSATIHGDKMIACGGIGENMENMNFSTYCFDLNTWEITTMGRNAPPPIFGASQIYVDKYHLLVMGGWQRQGVIQVPNLTSWLLSMEEDPWQWHKVTDENVQWLPPKKAFLSPVVSKVGNYLVAFSYVDDEQSASDRKRRKMPETNGVPEENINGRRGHLRQQNPLGPEPHPRPNPVVPIYQMALAERRQQQLDALLRYAKRYSNEGNAPKKSSNMALYLGDITDIVKTHRIVWKEPRCTAGCQGSRTLYTQTVARSEIVLFGGLAWNDSQRREDLPLVEENTLAIVKAPFILP